MKIEFNYTDAEELQKTLTEFKEFKKRYLNIAAGRREINDDDRELERIAVVLETEEILEDLLTGLTEFEREHPFNKE